MRRGCADLLGLDVFASFESKLTELLVTVVLN